ncbi:MAG: response regulator, partial [Pseudomonadota bacterium]
MREQLRVLLVEDSPTQANVISKMIERQGGKPTLAKTGDQALKFVQSEYFDLMLVDLTLGKENSVQYISYFREARPEAVVAAMTAGDWDPTEELHYARTAGAQFALKKPFSEQEVADLLTDTRMMLETQTRRMHVLVVDDSRTQRKMVARDLRDAECRVSTAESVSEAVERLGYSDVDTVVMDI